MHLRPANFRLAATRTRGSVLVLTVFDFFFRDSRCIAGELFARARRRYSLYSPGIGPTPLRPFLCWREKRVRLAFGQYVPPRDSACTRRPLHGWHAFRRGLATILFGLGVPAETAKTILRHARVETTRAHYIILESQKAGRAAMLKLEKKIGQWAANGQHRKPRKSRKPA